MASRDGAVLLQRTLCVSQLQRLTASTNSCGVGNAGAVMKRKWRWLLLSFAVFVALVCVYVRTHPLVFMNTHAHCIKFAYQEMTRFAGEHEGRFPSHPKGYPNALLLLDEESFHTLTGPGYDAAPLREAKRTGRALSEEECGRVYIQGLTTKSNWELALLFDKLPTPGGDHCPFPIRIWAPLGREVLLMSGRRFVPETEWPEFAKKQVDLLVQEGFDRQEAERLFASKPK